MASLSRAVNNTTDMALPAALVVIGSLSATVATDVLKTSVYNVPIQGGDALYPLVVVMLLNATMSGSTVRYVSLGMVSSSVSTFARSYGLL